MKFLIDSNILLRLADHSHPLSAVLPGTFETFANRGDTLVGAAQVMIEFWAVATRPMEANGLGFSPQEAEDSLNDFEELLTFLDEPPDIRSRWRALVKRHRVLGKQVHDARLVAFIEAHGLDGILTLNSADFSRYTAIKVISPLAPV